jgi:ribosomal protein L21E
MVIWCAFSYKSLDNTRATISWAETISPWPYVTNYLEVIESLATRLAVAQRLCYSRFTTHATKSTMESLWDRGRAVDQYRVETDLCSSILSRTRPQRKLLRKEPISLRSYLSDKFPTGKTGAGTSVIIDTAEITKQERYPQYQGRTGHARSRKHDCDLPCIYRLWLLRLVIAAVC